MTGSGASPRFSDGKDPGALRTIGEVASALGIRQHVLRYWEQQFPMLRPLKRSGGRRYYRPEDVALVERIDTLVNREGYTLRGARQALEVDGAEVHPGAPPVSTPKVAAADLLPQLRAIRTRLEQALQA
jgi:DNA-binding transcriptional MerR regulator